MRVMIRCSPKPFAPTARPWRRAALVLSFAAFGCVGQPADIAAPSKNAAVPRQSGSNSEAQTAGKGFVTCDVAVRMSADTYRVKKVSVELPMTIRDSAASLVKFVFLAWRHDGRDPSRLAACQVPNSPQPLAYFDAMFRRGTAAIVEGSDQSVRVANSHARERRGKLRYLDVDEGECASDGPIDYGCTCSSSTCAGWTMATVNSAEPPPPVEGDVQMSYSSSPDYGDPTPRPVIWCTLQTENVHITGTPGYGNNLSVHGWTDCSSEVGLSLKIELQKEICLPYDIYCWFQTAVSGAAGPMFGRDIDAHTNFNCSEGWWSGVTTHDVTFGFFYIPFHASVKTYGNWSYMICQGAPL